MDAAWIAEYKKEIDRERRNRILEREKEAHEGEPEYEIRRKLWNGRYDKKNGQAIDYGIRGWVTLQGLKRRVYLPGESKRLRKEIDGIRKDWQFDLCEEYGEVGEKALYDELFNLAIFYFDLCERDKTYNSVVLGLGHISDERRAVKISKEVRELTEIIPVDLDITEEFQVFIRAAKDALSYSYPETVSGE